MRQWLAAPRSAVILGVGWTALGLADLALGNIGYGTVLLILGLLLLASGGVRMRELQRAEQFSGPLGLLSALSRPRSGGF